MASAVSGLHHSRRAWDGNFGEPPNCRTWPKLQPTLSRWKPMAFRNLPKLAHFVCDLRRSGRPFPKPAGQGDGQVPPGLGWSQAPCKRSRSYLSITLPKKGACHKNQGPAKWSGSICFFFGSNPPKRGPAQKHTHRCAIRFGCISKETPLRLDKNKVKGPVDKSSILLLGLLKCQPESTQHGLREPGGSWGPKGCENQQKKHAICLKFVKQTSHILAATATASMDPVRTTLGKSIIFARSFAFLGLPHFLALHPHQPPSKPLDTCHTLFQWPNRVQIVPLRPPR